MIKKLGLLSILFLPLFAFSQCTTSGTSPNISLSCPGATVPPSAVVIGSDAQGNLADHSSVTINNNTTGNAATATAESTAGTLCPSGQAAGGVDTHWNAANCFTPSGTGSGGTPVYKLITSNYTMLSTDFSNASPSCGTIVIKNGSVNTLTVPPSTSQPPAGQCVHIVVIGGTATLTENGQIISNGTYYYPSNTITLATGYDNILYSDGTNFILTASIVSALDNDADQVIGSINIGSGMAGASGATQVGGGQGQITGGQNVAVGWESFNGSTVSGAYNTFLGDTIWKGNNVSGSYNTMVGAAIGRGGPLTGSFNLFLGYGTGTSASMTGNNNICIGAGYQSGYKGTCYQLANGNSLTNNFIVGGSTPADVPDVNTSNYINIMNWLIGDSVKGFFMHEGPVPHIANNACGTSTQGTLKAGSTDVSGEITVGTNGITSCALLFANTHNVIPNCILTPHSANTVGLYVSGESTTGFSVLSVLNVSTMDGGTFAYYCPESSNTLNPAP